MIKVAGGLFFASSLEAAEGSHSGASPQKAWGPLRVHPNNSRYFTADGRTAVYLTGSHTWSNLQDLGTSDPPKAFDFDRYLNFLDRYGHNFIRLWRWELPRWRYGHGNASFGQPHPWMRTGPGTARDGKPKFDLTKFNPDYFKRLRERVEKAAKRGIYVSVMLFEGHCLQFSQEGWGFHPFHPDNNINGINGNRLDYYTLKNPGVLNLQRAYIRKVIETVGDLDNVLYEISNEAGRYSTDWQYELIRFVKEMESKRGKVHPVGMTFQYGGDQSGSNENLFNSPADWISPNPEGGFRDDPPPNDGRKVILNDTDHLWGEGGNPDWVWKTFTRGHYPLFMDRISELMEGTVGWDGRKEEDIPGSESIRKAMGVTRRLALKCSLAELTPVPELASSGYCLANPSWELIVYVPAGGEVRVNLQEMKGTARVHWIHPIDGLTQEGGVVKGGDWRPLTVPWDGAGVAYVKRSLGPTD